eukprot:2363717-Amphidinium_carterae.1
MQKARSWARGSASETGCAAIQLFWHASRTVQLHGYQYKSASYVTNELIGPAVFFRIDIDPIRATYYTEERRPGIPNNFGSNGVLKSVGIPSQ